MSSTSTWTPTALPADGGPKSRIEILAASRALADWISESELMDRLINAELRLYEHEMTLEDVSETSQEPLMVEYVKARNDMERLLHQVTAVLIRPLTGRLPQNQKRGCGGSGGSSCPTGSSCH